MLSAHNETAWRVLWSSEFWNLAWPRINGSGQLANPVRSHSVQAQDGTTCALNPLNTYFLNPALQMVLNL